VSFVTSLALAVSLLVLVPYFAHRLRRRRADERAFAPARLVAPSPPMARRRSKLEDRALFGVRAAAIVALAVLGASPLVRCSRLSFQRSGGASVALSIVVDDSMSMRASANGTTRFERARSGARELLASAREGDAVAVVLAGAPARVALAATTDLSAARAAIDALAQTDRATDLDGALALARGLVATLPQVDRRVVVLSDLADGTPDAPPLGEGSALPVWVALPELRVAAADCGIVAADRSGARARVEIACGRGGSAAGREVAIVDAKGATLVKAAVPSGEHPDVSLALPSDAPEDLQAKLSPGDAIAADDVAPLVLEAGPAAIAVVADPTEEAAATGGAPIVEQALAALKLDVAVRPIPQFPDRVEDLTPFVGVVLDDPPGLTPEQRRALATYADAAGVVLLALGPRAAAAPLGASLEPVVAHPIAWSATTAAGGDPATATEALAESAVSLADIGAKERAVLAPEDIATFEALVKWTDGAPLVARRSIGRGEAWLVTLPFAVGASDLTLRPAYLALLDAWVAAARGRTAPRRADVGAAWTFAGASAVSIVGPAGATATTRDGAQIRASADVIGAYRVTIDGRTETRVAAPAAREIDIRPRAAAPTAGGSALGDDHASVDVSSSVAFVMLALLTLEIALRLWTGRTTTATA
jgi:hypothetical protein